MRGSIKPTMKCKSAALRADDDESACASLEWGDARRALLPGGGSAEALPLDSGFTCAKPLKGTRNLMEIRTNLLLSAYAAKLVPLTQTYLELRLPLPAALRSALADLDQLA
jgi:hypothetical protein